MAEVITPKRQAVVDRLRRRIENYRKHQTDCIPRFQQAFTGIVEQNVQDTLALKQRYLENKSKRAAKKTEKKIPDNPLQGLHAVTFVPKRPAGDDHDGYGHGEGPPPPKQQPKPSPGEPLTKFSVEIVQQLEFTTSAGNNSQISTNVTVKALNTSVKSDLSTTTVSPQPPTPTTVECKREQEDNPEFVDLEQCAAALEKDAAANGGNSFPGFSDLIGDETSDAIITSDAFKDLISEISDFHPSFLKDLDFVGGDTKHNVQSENHTHNNHHHHHHQQQQQQQHVFKTEEDSKSNILSSHQQQQRAGIQQQRMYSSGMDFAKAELSPAAQTLKQMAEQHQHKTQLGMNFNPANKPYSEFQYNNNDFIGSPQNNNVNSQYKPMVSQSPKSNYVSSDNIKQEVFSAQNSPGVYSPGSGKGNQTPTGQPRLNTGFKQQYSPYGSPGAGAHGSPQYTPRAPSQGPPPQAPPPRPPSCPSSTTLQINQAQQLHISQAQGQPIQVSMAQSQNLCTDMKGSTAVSIAAQQGLYMSPISTSSESLSYCSVSQSQSISLTQRHRVGDKILHPQEKMMHPQEKMMHQQEKMMHQQEKMMHPQEKMMHQQEKMMHQQEKMMHAQEKMMHPQMIRLPQQQVRPPPPEYKVSQQQMPQLHPSMLQHQNFLSQQRISQQPLPPSGPMMRPGAGGNVGAGYMVGGGGPRLQYTRPQRPLGPSLHSGSPEWRHMLQQHQPQRPTFHQGQGVMFSGGDMQMGAAQLQQVSHLSQHQSLAMQHSTPQMSVNLQMQQNMGGGRQHHSHPPTSQMTFPSTQTFTPSPATSQYNTPYTSLPLQLPSTNDFNLDFLDHDQDLLSSLDSGGSFNIHDIL